jgi:peptidyl-prolyl cis-trans isomerase A (cyclophilin A)
MNRPNRWNRCVRRPVKLFRLKTGESRDWCWKLIWETSPSGYLTKRLNTAITFIKLVKENYYDSLLIHRVISNFGIQTGAADTRYAEEGDLVGWKGPGYTLPAHIVPGLFHKRGMIGSPRKPDTQNQRRRADGSQFYIVTGRKYFDKGLNDIEEENDYKFTAEQRQVYKTIGGAPHLDGTYTIFGEVISGMEVADKIVQVETNRQWRPYGGYQT